jgi:histidyl-tRNA synthetase
MFRYERPQPAFQAVFPDRGEAFGVVDPKIDAEILSMLRVLFERLRLKGLHFQSIPSAARNADLITNRRCLNSSPVK